MAPIRKTSVSKQQRSRAAANRKRRPRHFVPSIFGPVREYTVKSCSTQYIVTSETTNFGYVYGHKHLVDYSDIVNCLKTNGITDFDDLRVLSIDINFSAFLLPETHVVKYDQFKSNMTFPSDNNYHPVKGELVVPVHSATSESTNDYFVTGFILRDAELQADFKFSSVDNLLSHPTMQHRILSEPQIAHYHKKWVPTEPSEKDWLTSDARLFTTYILFTNMDSTGWVSPSNFRKPYRRSLTVVERFKYTVQTRGKRTTVAASFEANNMPPPSSEVDEYEVMSESSCIG